MITKKKVVAIIKEIINLLIAKKYEELVRLDYLKNYTESELDASIKDYGGIMTLPPLKEFEIYEIYETENSDFFRVDFDLWFDGNKSYLTLSFTIYKINEQYKYSIDNIRVQ